MNPFKRVEDIPVWQTARKFAADADNILNASSFADHPLLKDQLVDSSTAVMDNIAEGFEHTGNRKFPQYLFSAKGATGKFRSQLYRALDTKSISESDFKTLNTAAQQLDSEIDTFILTGTTWM